jgi:hypothetical protein
VPKRPLDGPARPPRPARPGAIPSTADPLERARRALLAYHDAGHSWAETGRRFHLAKSTAYAVARGYVPKDEATLRRLHALRLETIVQVVTRDRRGRWASPKK